MYYLQVFSSFGLLVISECSTHIPVRSNFYHSHTTLLIFLGSHGQLIMNVDNLLKTILKIFINNKMNLSNLKFINFLKKYFSMFL